MNEAILCTFRPCPGCGTPLMVKLSEAPPFCSRCGEDRQPPYRKLTTAPSPAVSLERQSRRNRLATGLTISVLYWIVINATLDWLHATVGVICIWLFIALKEHRLRRLARGL